MALNKLQEVIQLQQKLEKNISDDKALHIIKKLKNVPMTVEILLETGIGKTIRNLRKKPGDLGKCCKALIMSWKDVVVLSASDVPEQVPARDVPEQVPARDVPEVSSRRRTLKVEREDSYTVYGNDEPKPKSAERDKAHGSSRNGSVAKRKSDETAKAEPAGRQSSKQHKDAREKKRKDVHVEEEMKKPAKDHSVKAKKVKMNKSQKKLLTSSEDTDGFTSSMASFEDCLTLNDVNKVKAKKKAVAVAAVSPPKRSKAVASSSLDRANSSSNRSNSSSNRANSSDAKSSSSSAKRKKADQDDEATKEEIRKALEINIDSTLPMPNPTYRPMRHTLLDSPPRKRKPVPEVDPTAFVSSRHNRTQVFSGRRNHTAYTEVPSLYDMCIRVLQENIDALEFTGGVPYDQLKPVLQRCTPQQLYQVEDYNSYLVEETDELWQTHCQHEFKGKQPDECETWREFYLRKFDEREAKFKSLTASISASMAKAVPVRQTKLAYIDTVAKPPRNIARKQAKYGTAKPAPAGKPPGLQASKPPSNSGSGPSTSGASRPDVSVDAVIIQPHKAKKVAPLMQKTLKLLRANFRR